MKGMPQKSNPRLLTKSTHNEHQPGSKQREFIEPHDVEQGDHLSYRDNHSAVSRPASSTTMSRNAGHEDVYRSGHSNTG